MSSDELVAGRRKGQQLRYRNVSGRPLDRRVVMKASAGLAAIAASGGIGSITPAAIAQDEERVTRSDAYVPSEAEIEAMGEWHEFSTPWPFYALGISWNGGVGQWPVIEVQLSLDGESWSEIYRMAASNDSGQPAPNGRIFTPLVHSAGAQGVRYRTVDGDGAPGQVAGLRFVYIDATDGPWQKDLAVGGDTRVTTLMENTDTRTPPDIVTRAQWGANESYRFASYGEVWPPEYQTVSQIIIHHTDTPNSQDIPTAIRSIYYYHAIEQEWGDIGYNYLVGRDGRIYEGRYGGQNVVGGHAFQFAFGSSGICVIGDYQSTPVPAAALGGLVAITAWAARDLDPYGTHDFHEAPDLPVIASHRDVNATTCPGDYLWNDLPEIRDLVAASMDSLDTGNPGGIIPGDRVRVQTDDGSDLNVRSEAGTGSSVIGSLANGAYAMVVDGPVELSSANWYMVEHEGSSTSGWVTAQYLIVAPIPPPPGDADDFPFGVNIIASDSVNLRSAPTTSAGVLATISEGTLAFVLAGPQHANGYEWYQIHTEPGDEGWAVKSLLALAPFDENPAAAFDVGDIVEATEYMNIRSRPGLANTIIATVGAGGRMQITQPPVGVNGYVFYGVYSDSDDGGWAVENTMRLVGATPAGKFDIGDFARVTEATNLRTSASTAASVVVTMPAGTTGQILSGPQSGSGYTWWRYSTSLGTGWAVQDWLVEIGNPNDKFDVGDSVRVTEAVNMRPSAGTDGGVIAVLPAGTVGEVVAGPTDASGYTWWRITTPQGTGWVVEDWLEESDLVHALIAVLVRILRDLLS